MKENFIDLPILLFKREYVCLLGLFYWDSHPWSLMTRSGILGSHTHSVPPPPAVLAGVPEKQHHGPRHAEHVVGTHIMAIVSILSRDIKSLKIQIIKWKQSSNNNNSEVSVLKSIPQYPGVPHTVFISTWCSTILESPKSANNTRKKVNVASLLSFTTEYFCHSKQI